MSLPVQVEEIIAKVKKHHPSSHIFKIDNFSLLKKYEIEDCESSVFHIGGYKWKLILYPNGNVNDNGKGHVSLYLEIQDSNSLPSNWQLKVDLTIFVINQYSPYWTTDEETEGTRVFNASKIKSGAARLISLATLYDGKEGFLVDDCALFGAQIKITGLQGAETGTAECFKIMEKPPNNKATWKMSNFSAFIRYPKYSSKEFIIGDRKWRMNVYPTEMMKGDEEKWFSIYLEGGEYVEKAIKTKTFVKFKLRILDQIHGKHFQPSASCWFPVEPIDYGFPAFMRLRDLYDPSKGFLVNETLYMGVEIDAISTTRPC